VFYGAFSTVLINKMLTVMSIISFLQVSADVVSVLIEKSDIVTLDISTTLLPLLTSLLGSDMDR